VAGHAFQLSGNFHDHFDADQGDDFVSFQVAGEVALGRRGNSKARAGDLRCGLRFEFNDGLAQIEPARLASLLVAADVPKVYVGQFVAEYSEAGSLVQLVVGDHARLPSNCVIVGRGEARVGGRQGLEGNLDGVTARVFKEAGKLLGFQSPLATARFLKSSGSWGPSVETRS
jgi:hypothetical protein